MLIARWDALDFDIHLFESVASALDAHLSRLDDWAQQDVDADSWGVYDEADHTAGMGFAAAQHYIAGVCRWTEIPKVAALSMGPRHATGERVVRLVNSAANYWKHRDEWELQVVDKGRINTEAALSSLGVGLSESYPLTHLLAAFGTTRVSDLGQLLAPWRDELLATARARRPPDRMQP